MSASRQFKIIATEETVRRLHAQAAELGESISPNGIVSAVAYEISRVPASRIWDALAAIRLMGQDAQALPDPAQTQLATHPGPSEAVKRATRPIKALPAVAMAKVNV